MTARRSYLLKEPMTVAYYEFGCFSGLVVVAGAVLYPGELRPLARRRKQFDIAKI